VPGFGDRAGQRGSIELTVRKINSFMSKEVHAGVVFGGFGDVSVLRLFLLMHVLFS